jgi:hypothetical protein
MGIVKSPFATGKRTKKFSHIYCDMAAERLKPEETAVARERPIISFPQRQTRDATIEELLEMMFSIG